MKAAIAYTRVSTSEQGRSGLGLVLLERSEPEPGNLDLIGG